MRIMWLGTYESDYPRGAVLREGLTSLGHEVIACHEPVWQNTRHKAGGFLRPGRLARTGLQVGRAEVALAARARRVGPVDAIVVGYPAQLDMPMAVREARRRRVPLVADLMISLSDTLAGDRGRVGAVANRGLLVLDRFAARHADVVMADTHANAAWWATTMGLPEGRVAVVPVGAEPGRFPAAPPPDGPPRALFVGKLSPLHGLPTVLAAFRQSGMPPLTIVGDGQLAPWLGDELARDRPTDLVHIPWVAYPELGATIASHHIVLGVFGASDKAQRVVANKVWQAMAVGRPVVTADTPGAREVLRHGQEGLLTPVGDPAALAAVVCRLGADAALRARLGDAAHARFQELGAPVVVAQALVDAIRAARR